MPHGQDLSLALEAERRLEREFLDSLPAGDLDQPSDFEHWSPKDLLHHITAWKEQAGMRLRGDPAAVPDETDDQVNAANAKFFADAAGQTWQTVQAKAEAVNRQLAQMYSQLAPADLDDTHAGGWTTGLPLWRTLASNTIGHAFSHLVEHALERKDRHQALYLVQETVRVMKPISPDPAYQGAIDYNAACLLARAGEAVPALERLEAGLRARPDLITWSKKDPDLDSLRLDGSLERLVARLAG
jgi:DinB superfamily